MFTPSFFFLPRCGQWLATGLLGLLLAGSIPAGAESRPLPGGVARVAAVPVITSLQPDNGAVGSTLRINGTGFGTATVVQLNGQSVASFTVNGAGTRITTTVPTGGTTGFVTVANPDGTAVSPTKYYVNGSISSFTPASGAVGTVVTVTGINFTEATSVTFNNRPAPVFTIDSNTQLTVTVPDSATTGRIRILTPANTAVSATNFTVVQAPTITAFSPASGLVGTAVTINGTSYNTATSVQFNGTAAAFNIDLNTRIKAFVPAGATTGPITITNAAGTVSSVTSFTVIPAAPTLTAFSPAAAAVGAFVVLTGTNFTPATAVTFNNQAASFTIDSPTQITATVPATATTGRIRVLTPGGTAVSATNFLVAVVPTITSFTPATSAVGGAITINGTGFSTATSVKVNGTAAAFTIASNGRITATVPAGATTGALTVTNPAGTATSATNLTISATAPTITSLNPTNGNAPVGPTPATSVQINGSAFFAGTISSVRFNGVATTFVRNSNSRITAPVPAGATTGKVTVTTANGTATSGANFVVNNTESAPTITNPGLQRTCASAGVVTITYTVGDTQTPANDLVVTGTAATPGVVVLSADLTGTGTNRQASVEAVDPAAGGTTTVTLTVTDGAGLTGTAMFTVTFDPVVTASAGPDQVLAANQTVSLTGAGTGPGTTVAWTTTGSGTFADATLATTTYSPSFADYQAGSVGLTLTATPAAGSACAGVAATATITFTRPALTVSGAENVSGVYATITVLPEAVATLTGPTDVSGLFEVQADGELLGGSGCEVLMGSGSFSLAAGALLHVCHPQGISASGASGQIQVSGTRTFSGAADYQYEGDSAQAGGSGLAGARDLTVANAGGVDLTTALSVSRLLTLATGDLRTANDAMLTLLSAAAGTAMVVNTAGVVTGAATVRRYLDPSSNPGMGYHHLSPPVTNTIVADLETAGFSPVVNAAYNLLSNPLSVRPYPNVFGYDETRFPASADFAKGYFSPTSLASPLEWGRGYSIYMMGGLTPDFTGTLGNGSVTRSGLTRTGSFAANTQKSGWHLLGNPYPAPIDWNLVTIPARLSPAVSVYRGTGPNSGVYQVYTNGIGPLGTSLIGVAQGFFVRVVSAGAPVSFALTNACRLTSYAAPTVYRSAEERPLVGLALRAAAATAPEEADEAFLYFQDGATAGYDETFDGAKPAHNPGLPTLVMPTGGEELAVNALAPAALTTGARVALLLDLPAAGTYVLETSQLRNLPAGAVALADALTGTVQPLTAGARYTFRVVAAGELSGRFSLLIGQARVLGTAAATTAGTLAVWPNPARTSARVAVPAAGMRLVLTDGLGRTVRTIAAAETTATLDLAGLPAGVYTLRAGAATTKVVVE